MMMAVYERTPVEKKLLDNLQGDLRQLSTEARKRHPPLKEAAEAGIVKVRNASMKHDDLRLALLSESPEILEPFFMGCDTKNPKIVHICLTGMQRLITYEAVSSMAAPNIITCLWSLMECGIEELKLLQTVTLLISSNSIVQGETLSKALVLCFRLHFTKNSITINTASATVRHLMTSVFERVLNEDATPNDDKLENLNLEELKMGSRHPPKSLRPSAADAYLLFQDLVQMVNADQPVWLTGLTEMTRTFGLELLESILTKFPDTFNKHPEFSFLLKERVCPLVIKLFSPNIKYRQGMQNPATPPVQADKPYFPISMRLLRIVAVLIQKYYPMLVTECEIFLSLIVKFLEKEKPQWQRALALEVLHKLCTQPRLLRCFCESYDMKAHSTKIFQDMVNSLGTYVQANFLCPSMLQQQGSGSAGGQGGAGTGLASSSSASLSSPVVIQGQNSAVLTGGSGNSSGSSPQPAFYYRGIWLPIVVMPTPGVSKPTFLELLDKLESPCVPDGYGLSVAYACLLETVQGIATIMGEESKRLEGQEKGQREVVEESKEGQEKDAKEEERKDLSQQLVESSWCGLLAAFSMLLDASTDESTTETLLKSLQTYTSLCGELGMKTPRDAFITAMCKASLPPHYTLTVLNAAIPKGLTRANSQDPNLPALNLNPPSASMSQPSLGLYLGGNDPHEHRQQVVAVGTALPTSSLPLGAQQGPVMLTAKNLQCMRAILSLAHCHGAVLGTAWHLVLTTLQHLVWILGLKPSTGGSLKASRSNDASNATITTAIMADLPVLSAMLSRLFESSQYLDDVALHHLIDALCQLSAESMELAYTNREPSLFAVAKLLETGLVNLSRVQVLWRPITNHLLEVCHHPHIRMREWGAEAVTYLIKAALNHEFEPPLKQNSRIQSMLLLPLQELSSIGHADIRQKQLECTLQILQNNGESISVGWLNILAIIGAISEQHGEVLIRAAFQCLQLVVGDYLSIMPCSCLESCVDTTAKFGLQNQELNVSLTAIGLMWNIADHLFQNQSRISKSLEDRNKEEKELKAANMSSNSSGSSINNGACSSKTSPFDGLWMCLFSRLGDLCVDSRPAVRKSAGQTLFSTISAHGALLQQTTWQAVIWQVLFPLLDQVKNLSGTASTDKITDMGGNILIHHSRNTAQKQWAETQVLTLSGVARVFHTKRYVLQNLGDFPRAWTLLLQFIETAALSKNNEVSLSSLKSFQEILNITRVHETKEHLMKEESTVKDESHQVDNNLMWTAAWKVWYNIGIESTKPPPEGLIADVHAKNDLSALYIPSQPFLTALVQIFPFLFQHVKSRFVASDLQKLSSVLQNAVAVPVYGEASPFILPSLTEVVLSPLQEAVLQAMEVLQKEVLKGGENIQAMVPSLFSQLLQFSCYACRAPPYGKLQTRMLPNVKSTMTDWVTMNFVPFGERSLEMVVKLYQQTASKPGVIQSHILQLIIKTLKVPLGLKYSCPSQSTWKLAVTTLLRTLQVGLPVARLNGPQFQGMWSELASVLEDFLFTATEPIHHNQLPDFVKFFRANSKSLIDGVFLAGRPEDLAPLMTLLTSPPPTQSLEDQQLDESLDCKIIDMVRSQVLPFASQVPREFVLKTVALLNRGSIHSATSTSPVDMDSSRRLREDFAKACFETLLQFSFLGDNASVLATETSTLSDAPPGGGLVNKLAVTALLHRFQEVIKKYVEDERLSGKCPLPRHRVSEISFVLKAVATLTTSLKKAPADCVDRNVWQQLMALYPHLVDCTTSTSSQVCASLREALYEYADLLSPPIPNSHLSNGNL